MRYRLRRHEYDLIGSSYLPRVFGTDGVPLRIERMGRHLIATGLLAEDALWVFDAESGRRIARARLNGASSAADQVTRIGRAVAEGVVSATHPKEDQVVLLGRFSGKMHLVNLASWTAIVRPLPVPMDARLRIDASSNGVSRLVWHRSATLGYVNVAASLERIYALYCGCTLADSSSARELHIFDWSGELQEVWRLAAPSTAVASSVDGMSLFVAEQREGQGTVIRHIPLTR